LFEQINGAAFRPRGWYLPAPRKGICGLPFTIVGTARPAALCASSTLSFAFALTLTKSLPSPSLAPPVATPAAPPADRSSSNPDSPRPILYFALLQKRQPPAAPFRFRTRWVETLRGSRGSARDECTPCLRIPQPVRLLPTVAERPCRRHR